MEFGENLKKAREEKGITQQTLAEQLYVTRQAVSRWEGGSRYPDLLTTKCIANILGVSIDSLVSNDEMKEFTEKQSITGGQKSGKIITVLYAVISLLCILKLAPTTMNFALYYENKNLITDPQYINIVMIPTVMYIVVGILSLVSFIKSLRDDVTPKVAGAIGMIYYSVFAIENIVVVAFHGVIWQMVLTILLSISFIVIICGYFFGNRIKLSKFVCVGCAASAIWIFANPIYQSIAVNDSISKLIELASLSSIMELFINLAFVGILFYQTVLLERKRKLCEKNKAKDS